MLVYFSGDPMSSFFVPYPSPCLCSCSCLFRRSTHRPRGIHRRTARWTLLLFYSPTCLACTKVMPTFEQLAKKLAVHSQGAKDGGPGVRPLLHIARLEKPVNDVPIRGLLITHFPTVFLFKASSGKIVEALPYTGYSGEDKPHDKSHRHSHYDIEQLEGFLKEKTGLGNDDASLVADRPRPAASGGHGGHDGHAHGDAPGVRGASGDERVVGHGTGDVDADGTSGAEGTTMGAPTDAAGKSPARAPPVRDNFLPGGPSRRIQMCLDGLQHFATSSLRSRPGEDDPRADCRPAAEGGRVR